MNGSEFTNAIETNAEHYGVTLNTQTVTRLEDYYKLIQTRNQYLHLVAPCSPEEFAKRHILESLMALKFLKDDSGVADVGSGGGLPVIPCLIARPSLKAVLIESSQKKVVFLREALQLIENKNSIVVNERFEKTGTLNADFITCRALEKFSNHFKTLVKWSPPRATLLLFAGENLRVEIEKAKLDYEAIKMPFSERRYLFIVKK